MFCWSTEGVHIERGSRERGRGESSEPSIKTRLEVCEAGWGHMYFENDDISGITIKYLGHFISSAMLLTGKRGHKANRFIRPDIKELAGTSDLSVLSREYKPTFLDFIKSHHYSPTPTLFL